MSRASKNEPHEDFSTRDEVAGMAWWNALSQAKRLFWLTQAGGAAAGASAAAAWAAFKRADPGEAARRDGEGHGHGESQGEGQARSHQEGRRGRP